MFALNILTGVLVNVIQSPLYVNNINFTVGLSPDGLRSPFLLSNASSPNLDNSPEGGRTYLRGRKMIEHNSPTAEENITAALEEKKASNYVRKAARSLEYLVGSLANLPHYISHGGIQKFSTGKKENATKAVANDTKFLNTSLSVIAVTTIRNGAYQQSYLVDCLNDYIASMTDTTSFEAVEVSFDWYWNVLKWISTQPGNYFIGENIRLSNIEKVLQPVQPVASSALTTLADTAKPVVSYTKNTTAFQKASTFAENLFSCIRIRTIFVDDPLKYLPSLKKAIGDVDVPSLQDFLQPENADQLVLFVEKIIRNTSENFIDEKFSYVNKLTYTVGAIAVGASYLMGTGPFVYTIYKALGGILVTQAVQSYSEIFNAWVKNIALTTILTENAPLMSNLIQNYLHMKIALIVSGWLRKCVTKRGSVEEKVMLDTEVAMKIFRHISFYLTSVQLGYNLIFSPSALLLTYKSWLDTIFPNTIPLVISYGILSVPEMFQYLFQKDVVSKQIVPLQVKIQTK